MNYKHLYYFWVVASEGSVVRAGKRLHITPQTISGQIGQLEARVGNPLFLKVGRGLELSETGRLVFKYADEMFTLGAELEDVLRGAPVLSQSQFIVGAASALPKTVVYKVIQPALSSNPHLNLISLEGPIEQLLAELAVHKIDLVLSDEPVPAHLSLKTQSHFLGASGLSFFAAPGLRRQLSGDFPDSLHHAPMLLPTRQNSIRQQFDEWVSRLDIHPRIRGQFDDSALMKAYGQAGSGIFFMCSTVEAEVCHNFGVEVIGRTREIEQRYYAISAQRKVQHETIGEVCMAARQSLSLTD